MTELVFNFILKVLLLGSVTACLIRNAYKASDNLLPLAIVLMLMYNHKGEHHG